MGRFTSRDVPCPKCPGQVHERCWTTDGRPLGYFHKQRVALARTTAAVMVGCTGLTASWCPVHGDCCCPRCPEGSAAAGDFLDGMAEDWSCPLHSPLSGHAVPGGEG